jgi:hypothetical protein
VFVGAGHHLVVLALALFVFFLAACILSWVEAGLRSSCLDPPPPSHIGILLYSKTSNHNLVADGGEGGG